MGENRDKIRGNARRLRTRKDCWVGRVDRPPRPRNRRIPDQTTPNPSRCEPRTSNRQLQRVIEVDRVGVLSYELDRAALDLLRHRGLISRTGRAFFAMPGTGKPPPKGARVRLNGFGVSHGGRLSDWRFRSRATASGPQERSGRETFPSVRGGPPLGPPRTRPKERRFDVTILGGVRRLGRGIISGGVRCQSPQTSF